MSGGLDAILAKRQRQPQAPDAPRDPTSEQRSELHKHRNKLTRAADDASFEQAAMEFDGLLDAISEGVGKAHAISQEECDAEASWLYDVVDQRTKTMRTRAPARAAPAAATPRRVRGRRRPSGGRLVATPARPLGACARDGAPAKRARRASSRRVTRPHLGPARVPSRAALPRVGPSLVARRVRPRPVPPAPPARPRVDSLARALGGQQRPPCSERRC